MEPVTLFADVILPLSLPRLYTYRIPAVLNEQVAVGKRVVVQFGKQKIYSALVKSIHEKPPVAYQAKYIISVLDEYPVVVDAQLKFWDWIAEYYMCNLGDVMSAALPSAFKLQSETRVLLNGNATVDPETLSDKEYLIIEALEIQNTLSLSEISKIIDQKTIFPVIKSLIEKKLIVVEEEIQEKYRPRVVTYITLSAKSPDDLWMKDIFDQLEKKAPKQLDALMVFYKLAAEKGSQKLKKELIVKALDGNSAAVQGLIKKGVFEEVRETEGRLLYSDKEAVLTAELSAPQEGALSSIRKHFEDKSVVLLHGITSSGKTEVYIKLIEETLADGRQVLFLLPEIALTAQMIGRLQKYFGSKVGIYHSRFNEQERVEIWNKVLTRKDIQVIVGARSALFLPFSDLGLVIVDEEHETSYKQFDPAPRYNARDIAIYLSQMHNARTLLGSATPSIESYYNAVQGKYGLVELFERYGNTILPGFVLANITEEKRKKTIKSHFTSVLLDAITDALENKEQVILFQNRRGYAPFLQCSTCAWVPHCVNCDVSLTYHKHSDWLKCHYCGYTDKPPSRCPACGNAHVQMIGFGTEKIEDELAVFFPQARIGRMDTDSTRSRNAFQKIISDFENNDTHILVGTQMVTKGLDFSNVSTVGILSADAMLNYPDFRAFERSFQMMTQVSGRAGRREKQGKVILQTSKPEHPVIAFVFSYDYMGLYKQEIAERQQFKYPPFYRLIEITVKHKDFTIINEASSALASSLKSSFQDRVLGPEFPSISRIKNLYLKKILLKFERGISLPKAKKIITEAIISLKSSKDFASATVSVDIDPN